MRTHTNRASVLLPGAVGAFHWKTLCFAWEKLKRSFSMTDPEGRAEITQCVSVRAQKATMLILIGNYQWPWMKRKKCLRVIKRCRKRRGTRANSFMSFHNDLKRNEAEVRKFESYRSTPESSTCPLVLLTLMLDPHTSACWVVEVRKKELVL